MSYLQVFINAIVIALMAMYVYENERKMEKMSTKHSQTEKELDALKIVAKSKQDQIKELKQVLSTKAETEKLTIIENQQIAGTRKLTEIENQQIAGTRNLTEVANQQIAGTRKLNEMENQLNAGTRKQAELENQQNTESKKLAEVENQQLKSNEKVFALERKLVDDIKDMKHLLSTQAEKKDFKKIFVACNGNKQSILDTWKKPTMGGDINNTKDSCTNRHLRSTMIDNWNGLLIDQVKVELFRNEQLAVEMFFDGRGSTSSNWFTKNRLPLSAMGSTFSTLHSSDQLYDRHFFINRNYGGGCLDDKGWMVVIDTADANNRPCKFDKLPGKDYPYILYGPDQQLAIYDQGKSENILVCPM
ncbi:unnamed protein product [Mytilus coruscus]|uniref:Fibrinogen C-terminal domain-containing protein n=1 Tax=Mytilus coruscus TaxID=42192 RepID=A0A6J8CG98_MYTCO|nr:unnamed protein product [Mytilus coruscus]